MPVYVLPSSRIEGHQISNNFPKAALREKKKKKKDASEKGQAFKAQEGGGGLTINSRSHKTVLLEESTGRSIIY